MTDVRTPSPLPAEVQSFAPPALERRATPLRTHGAVHNGRVWRRAGLVALGLVVVAGIAYAYLPEPIAVDLAAVGMGPLQVTVDEDGRTRVKDRYTVSAPLLATLARIELHPGDRIRTGQVLARLLPLDPPLLDVRTRAQQSARISAALATREQAASAVSRVGASLEYARSEAARELSLQGHGASAERALERAQLEAKTLEQELSSAQFSEKVADYEVQMARLALERQQAGKGAEQIEIVSPVDGQVLRVLQESASVVQPGAPILELGNLEALEIVVDVLTTEAVGIHPGAKAVIDHWGGPQPMAAHVRTVEPSAFTRVSALGVEEQRVNVLLDLDAPRTDWANLGDGYRVETRIEVWSAPAVLTAPGSAVFRDRDQWAAFEAVDGRARLQLLELGQRSAERVEIVHGLADGAAVVIHPSDRLTDGSTIEAR